MSDFEQAEYTRHRGSECRCRHHSDHLAIGKSPESGGGPWRAQSFFPSFSFCFFITAPRYFLLVRAFLSSLYEDFAFSSAVIARASTSCLISGTGMMYFVVFCGTFSSCARVESPPFTFDFRGKIMSFDLYSFRRAAFSASDSVHLFRRRWSTQIPIVLACFGDIFASRSSSRVNPRPTRSLELYRSRPRRSVSA